MTDAARAAALAAPPPLRILVLAPQPFFQDRGTPIAARALLETLAARGVAIDLLTFAGGRDVTIAGCTIHRIPAIPGTRGIRPGFSLAKLACDAVMAVQCMAMLATGRYALVHALEESAFIAMIARWMFGVPFVYDMDSSLAQQMEETYPSLGSVRALLKAFERAAIRASLGVIAVCPALRDIALGHAPGAFVRVIEDFSLLGDAPPSPAASAAPESLAATIGRSGPIVLYVGNLEVYQGIDLLIEAFAEGAPITPGAELVMIGGQADDIARYRERCMRLGIGDRVHILWPRPLAALGDLLRQATVVVSPRVRGLNTPMKVYSYLDSGRALLATDLPTHTQVLDGSVALLAPAEPAAFGAALARLLADDALRARLTAEAKRRVTAEWSRAAFRRKVDAFYDEVEARLAPEPWPLRLFRRSVIKQRKWRAVAAMLPAGPLESRRGLDVGADNGVISLLLRRAGGAWISADLDATTVSAIASLTGGDVRQIGDGPTPFADRAFDLIVIVDFLEHIHGDRAFAADLARILAPGGTLIVNVPHLLPGSIMNRIRDSVGLTDERHGHVRPGYTLAGLCDVLGDAFALEASATYSRAFSESVDIALNAAYASRAAAAAPTRKGTVVTAADLERMRGHFRMLSLAYPVLRAWTSLDALLAGQPGHILIARFRRV